VFVCSLCVGDWQASKKAAEERAPVALRSEAWMTDAQ
jgi:hypothetical protein